MVCLEVITNTHLSLIGYNVLSHFSYQDIQGVAFVNSNHKCDYKRYVKDGITNIYVCFYCDVRASSILMINGAEQMQLAAGCTHDYQPMVSAGNIYWHKCTKCYKAIEISHLNHSYNYSFTQITSTHHTAQCACGAFRTEVHSYIYTQATSTHHPAKCACGSSISEAHSFTYSNFLTQMSIGRLSEINTAIINPERFPTHTATCRICGYTKEEPHNYVVTESYIGKTYTAKYTCLLCGYSYSVSGPVVGLPKNSEEPKKE